MTQVEQRSDMHGRSRRETRRVGIESGSADRRTVEARFILASESFFRLKQVDTEEEVKCLRLQEKNRTRKWMKQVNGADRSVRSACGQRLKMHAFRGQL